MITNTRHWKTNEKARLRELRQNDNCHTFTEISLILSAEFGRTITREAAIGVAARMGLEFFEPSVPMRYKQYLENQNAN